MRTTYIEYSTDESNFYAGRQALLADTRAPLAADPQDILKAAAQGQLPSDDAIDPLRPENVRYLIVHCTATRCTADYRPEDLIRDHEARGWSAVGYHFFIRKNGQIYQFRRTDEKGAHCRGRNAQSIGIAYEGGLDDDAEPADTMTNLQIDSMRVLIKALARQFPNIVVRGHRDFNPAKACPCFDAKQRFEKCTNEPLFK